jgi:hypothetical protein
LFKRLTCLKEGDTLPSLDLEKEDAFAFAIEELDRFALPVNRFQDEEEEDDFEFDDDEDFDDDDFDDDDLDDEDFDDDDLDDDVDEEDEDY